MRSQLLMWRGRMWRGHSCPRTAYAVRNFAGKLLSRPLLFLAVLTAFMPWATAQTSVPTAPVRGQASHFHTPHETLAAAGRSHLSHRANRSSPLGSFLSPFFGDSFDLDDLAEPGGTSGAPPFLVEARRAFSDSARPAGQPEPSSSQPLLIELQGDRYVRVSSAAVDGEALPLKLSSDSLHQNNVPATQSIRGVPKQSVTQNSSVAASTSARDLPPAVLVFKDGHREQVRDYAITAGFLYARGDYYTDGYWNKMIDLSTLDIAETVQANNTRNVQFVLPSSPNEVVTRP